MQDLSSESHLNRVLLVRLNVHAKHEDIVVVSSPESLCGLQEQPFVSNETCVQCPVLVMNLFHDLIQFLATLDSLGRIFAVILNDLMHAHLEMKQVGKLVFCRCFAVLNLLTTKTH